MGKIMVSVLYFGTARDMAEKRKEEFSFPARASVGDLFREAEARHPGLARLRASTRIAIEETIVSGEVELHDGETVAILPPVAGG